MIMWSGFGFLVAVLGFAAAIATEIVSESITGNHQYYQQHPLLMLVAMSLAAVLTYGLHLLLQRQKGQVVVDKATGQELVLVRTHSLFHIPVKWWPAVFIVIGLALQLKH